MGHYCSLGTSFSQIRIPSSDLLSSTGPESMIPLPSEMSWGVLTTINTVFLKNECGM